MSKEASLSAPACHRLRLRKAEPSEAVSSIPASPSSRSLHTQTRHSYCTLKLTSQLQPNSAPQR